jgi:broad specificity phosphatase PhoE
VSGPAESGSDDTEAHGPVPAHVDSADLSRLAALTPLGDEPVLILARHGRTELNAGGLLRGHLDPALDEVGESEVVALGRDLAELLAQRTVIRIVCSPLRRAVQTAAAIAAALPTAPPVQADQGLIDRDYGHWAGHSREEVEARYGSVDAADGVEAASVVAERARAVLEAQVPVLSAGVVVLVAHDAVNRLLLASLDPSLGRADDIGQGTACWNLLSYRENSWRVERIDRTPRDVASQRGGSRSGR